MAKTDSEKYPPKPRGFLSFWRHGIKEAFLEAWEAFGHALVAGVVGYLVFALLAAKWDMLSTWVQAHSEDYDMSQWIEIYIPCIFGGLFLFWCMARAPYKIYKELYDKYESEIEKSLPKFKLSCGDYPAGCKVKSGNGQVYFFRMRVETDCINGIEKCLGHLTKIEKDGEIVFEHDSLELPFAKSEEPDSLAKRIGRGDPKWLDILFVKVHQPRRMDSTEILARINNPHAFQKEDDRDRVWIATRQPSSANDINGNYIFETAGEYILCVNVIGDKADARAVLKFTWTGYAATSTIEKIE